MYKCQRSLLIVWTFSGSQLHVPADFRPILLAGLLPIFGHQHHPLGRRGFFRLRVGLSCGRNIKVVRVLTEFRGKRRLTCVVVLLQSLLFGLDEKFPLQNQHSCFSFLQLLYFQWRAIKVDSRSSHQGVAAHGVTSGAEPPCSTFVALRCS